MRMLVHKLHLLDNFVICGDFNARCLDEPDIVMLDCCDTAITS